MKYITIQNILKFLVIFFLCFKLGNGLAQQPTIFYTVTMPQPETGIYEVNMKCNLKDDTLTFKMPVWTPGYYQILNYSASLMDFLIKTNDGKKLKFIQKKENQWLVLNSEKKELNISYKIKSDRLFVANVFLDKTHGYITPGGMFLYPEKHLKDASEIKIIPYKNWNSVATGLDEVNGKKFTYFAENFDVLYDSPFLIGNLEWFPSFTVKGIPHYFAAYNPGNFNKQRFMNGVKKIIETATYLMGDIPYKKYVFLGIGNSMGGIEHLNSASLSFSGEKMDDSLERIDYYSFLAHEYFHHFNVKRIRPVELGPFDYTKENRTKMLWVSEGLTVYYEWILLYRAGFYNFETLCNSFSTMLQAYENDCGHLYQSLTQSSMETWEDGPFGRKNSPINKTITYYEKGPVLGLLLNFAIEKLSGNKYSIDDVMRSLYNEIYKKKNRGFTEEEFWQICENFTGKEKQNISDGISIQEISEYISTTKSPNYPKYFEGVGLEIDTHYTEIPQISTGLRLKEENDYVIVKNVEWKSAAWEAGFFRNDTIVKINNQVFSKDILDEICKKGKVGEKVEFEIKRNGNPLLISLALQNKKERKFNIKQQTNASQSEKQSLKLWLEGK